MSHLDTPETILSAIEDWYDQNGSSSAIPNLGSAEVEVPSDTPYELAEAFNSLSNHTVLYGGDEIYEVRGNVLPLLAGVKLGFSPKTLAQIIAHHEISVDDILNLSFQRWGAHNNVVLTHRSGGTCTQFEFACMAFQAMNLLPEKQAQLANALTADPVYTLALMHVDHEAAWPSSQIKDRAAEAQTPAAKGFTRNPISGQDFSSIAGQLSSTASLPNHSPMEFIQRVGMLLPETAKRATAQYAIWEALAGQSEVGNSCCRGILDFCANHKNPQVQSAVRRALLSLGSYEGMDDPVSTHSHLKAIFDKDAYRDVFDQVIPRINLLPFFQDEFEDTLFYNKRYADFMENPERLFSTVAQELLAQPAADLGYNQLSIFSKLKALELPDQKIEGFKPEALLHHVLDGIGLYTAKRPLAVCEKSRMDESVKQSLSDLIRVLDTTRKLDFASFDSRTTQEKSLLIESGVPAKELKFRNNVANLFSPSLA